MIYRIVFTSTAAHLLLAVPDRRIQEIIRSRIDGLAHNPEQQGKPLKGELVGFRSLRAVGQRYRIIYRVENKRVIVTVVVVGLRKAGDKKDVYTIAKKLIRLRLL